MMSEHRTNSVKGAGRSVRSLRELPQERLPGRDLWPEVEARLTEPQSTGAESTAATGARPIEARPIERQPAGRRQVRRADWSGRRVRLAVAVGLLALGAAMTGGVWLMHGSAGYGGAPTEVGVVRGRSAQMSLPDARDRAAMLHSLSDRLQNLPPSSRQKVLADLQVIEQSMQDIQNALGRDPGNALLREMLSETYQDEQHLFATVQEAGVWTQEAGSGKGST